MIVFLSVFGTSPYDAGENDDSICKIVLHPCFGFLLLAPYLRCKIIHTVVTSKRQRCPHTAFIGRNKEYHSAAGLEMLHAHFMVYVLPILEDPTVVVKCRTAMLPVMLNSLTCSLTSISFLTN